MNLSLQHNNTKLEGSVIASGVLQFDLERFLKDVSNHSILKFVSTPKISLLNNSRVSYEKNKYPQLQSPHNNSIAADEERAIVKVSAFELASTLESGSEVYTEMISLLSLQP